MNHRRLLISAHFLAVVFTFAPVVAKAQGFNADYLPFRADLLRPFPMKRTAVPDDLHNGQTLLIAGVTISEEVKEKPVSTSNGPDVEFIRHLVFRGHDLRGRAWQLKTEACLYCVAVYEGDLDHNGVQDLIVASGTGGNGLAPPTYLLFLTFDRTGSPSFFKTSGFYDLKEDGISELADLDGDGRAELVYMSFDDGYWITNVYRMKDGRWNRIVGRFAALQFPLYTRFTKNPNHKPVTPARGRHPLAPDLLQENRRQLSRAGTR
jgi:hypothetical protein